MTLLLVLQLIGAQVATMLFIEAIYRGASSTLYERIAAPLVVAGVFCACILLLWWMILDPLSEWHRRSRSRLLWSATLLLGLLFSPIMDYANARRLDHIDASVHWVTLTGPALIMGLWLLG